MRRIGRIEGGGLSGERERGSTAEGIIMKRNGKQPRRGPGEFRHRLRDSAARPSVARVGRREGKEEREGGNVGMGSRQFDFHNGCVASQAAASGSHGSERNGRTRTALLSSFSAPPPPPFPPPPPRYVFRENRSLRKNGRGREDASSTPSSSFAACAFCLPLRCGNTRRFNDSEELTQNFDFFPVRS